MKTYRVKWEIDIEASSPLVAARTALEIQRDPHSIANVFDVREPSGNNIAIDLQTELDEKFLRKHR